MTYRKNSKLSIRRSLLCVLLFLALCSNECNAPYNATIVCRSAGDACRFRFSNNLEFTMKNANVSWWKGSLGIGVYYRAKNSSADHSDSIDYNRFSVVCSNGIKFYQARRKVGAITYPGMYTFTPAASIDTEFLFYSVDKYSRKQGVNILKTERFFLLYADGTTDTLLSVTIADKFQQ